jgi:plastocyanin
MGPHSSVTTRLLPLTAAAVMAFGLAGCELKDDGDNLVNGKTQFVAKCGSCHVLSRAGTTGVTGPNLDEAFRTARAQGFGESTFEGVVLRQIEIPSTQKQMDPQSLEDGAEMPANLVTGEDAEDVAAYVAQSVAHAGEDQGQLAQVGPEQSDEAATAENGEIEIPADPSGALLYTFGSATAPAGPLTMLSPNEASVPHNIALEGNGVDEVGEVVQNGGVSEISADLKAGEYAFYCSVPGHRQGGMEGTLTVE